MIFFKKLALQIFCIQQGKETLKYLFPKPHSLPPMPHWAIYPVWGSYSYASEEATGFIKRHNELLYTLTAFSMNDMIRFKNEFLKAFTSDEQFVQEAARDLLD